MTRKLNGVGVAALIFTAMWTPSMIAQVTTGATPGVPTSSTQTGTAPSQTNWPSYGNDDGQTKYSTLADITPNNVTSLARAWTFNWGTNPPASAGQTSAGPGAGVAPAAGRGVGRGGGSSATPLVVNGVLYVIGGGDVIALNATTGSLRWRVSVQVAGRGLAYWPGRGALRPRLIFAVPGALMALDAETGQPVEGFGVDGKVAFEGARVPNPLSIFEDLAIGGAATGEGGPPGPVGDIRAWNIVTGELVWTFHTVPHPGEPGFETWPSAESVVARPGANTWSMLSVDRERGLVFAPTGSPGYDFYGADRTGDNLYGSSVIALDARTGERRWHFQIIHHDLYDYDVTGAPSLVDVVKDGQRIPAIVQGAKTGYLWILNRETGEPVFGHEERTVPKSTMPGEVSSPTQPFPLKPEVLARTTMTRNDLFNMNEESTRVCGEIFERVGETPEFNPPAESLRLHFPGSNGGVNWGGVSIDPQLGYIFVNVSNIGVTSIMQRTPEGGYRNTGAFARFVDSERYPCQKPPWGELFAVNANTGDIVWRSTLGSYRQLEERGILNTGAPNLGGSVVTAGGVLFIGATNDRRFRAFDTRTGRELWRVDLEASVNATPITFRGADGKQYVVVVASTPGNWRNVGPTAGDTGDSVIAFALP